MDHAHTINSLTGDNILLNEALLLNIQNLHEPGFIGDPQKAVPIAADHGINICIQNSAIILTHSFGLEAELQEAPIACPNEKPPAVVGGVQGPDASFIYPAVVLVYPLGGDIDLAQKTVSVTNEQILTIGSYRLTVNRTIVPAEIIFFDQSIMFDRKLSLVCH